MLQFSLTLVLKVNFWEGLTIFPSLEQHHNVSPFEFMFFFYQTTLYSPNARLSVRGLVTPCGLPFTMYVVYTLRRVFSAFMTTHTDIVSSSKLKQTVWTALFLQETTARMFVMRYWTMDIVDTQISGSSGIWLALEIDSVNRYSDSIWRYGIACRCNSCVRSRPQLWEIQSFVGFLQKMSGKDLHMPTVIDLPRHFGSILISVGW